MKRLTIKIVKISIAIFVTRYLFKGDLLTKADLIQLFKIENLPYIVFSSLAFIVAQILMAFRLVLLLKTIDFPLSFFQSFKLTMIGNFFNCVIPGMMGGDAVKGFLLFKDEKKDRGRTLGIVILDRFIGIFALMCIGSVSLIFLTRQLELSLIFYRNNLYIILVAAGACLACAGIFLILSRSRRIRKKVKEFSAALFRKSVLYYIIDGIGTITKYFHIPVYAFGLSLLMHLSAVVGVLLLGNIVTESLPTPLIMMAISSIVFLLGVIPVTPGNIGWLELLAAYGWSSVGSDAGAEIFLSWRIITVLCSLSGGVLYLLTTKNQEQQQTTQRLAVDLNKNTCDIT